jgi:ornithine--oxo-acid transaminase
MSSTIDLENQFCAHNYHPLPVVLSRGKGVFVWDENGKKYLDMMSAYSAVSHGHANPRLVEVVKSQVEKLTIVSRAFYTDQLGEFLKLACELTGQDMALPMNTGAEGVETAIKAAVISMVARRRLSQCRTSRNTSMDSVLIPLVSNWSGSATPRHWKN